MPNGTRDCPIGREQLSNKFDVKVYEIIGYAFLEGEHAALVGFSPYWKDSNRFDCDPMRE